MPRGDIYIPNHDTWPSILLISNGRPALHLIDAATAPVAGLRRTRCPPRNYHRREIY